MIIQPIVEGEGDVKAVPILLRRLRDEAEAWGLEVARPHRRSRSCLAKKDCLQESVTLASLTKCGGILILLDADDDCPCILAKNIEKWAGEVVAGKPLAVVVANQEYEAWFLASMEALRGKGHISPDAKSHPNPENQRDAKGRVEGLMLPGFSYNPPADQPRLTALFDLKIAYQRCRSFRKLVRAFGQLAASAGMAPAVWPPADWETT